MSDYEKICDFGNLYKAHTVARQSKRDTYEVIDFELKLSKNLSEISDLLRKKCRAIIALLFMIQRTE